MASNKRMWGGEGGGGFENRHRFFFFQYPRQFL